jgi:thiol-disulfide isomerase/thioredoxin
MKNLLFLPLALVLLSSCDKVTNPLQDYVPPVEAKRKVLLEDFTGHKCGNCPSAADVATNLHKQYGENLVVVAVHAGYFSDTDKSYPTSYTTTAGNEWNTFYAVSGYPNGMVNRKDYDNSGKVNKETKWPTLVNLGLNDAFVLDLEINPIYGADSTAGAEVTATFKKAYAGNIKVIVALTEDSVIGPQLDYRTNVRNPNYVFNHMLRGAINGTWGTMLKKGPAEIDDEVTVSFSNFRLRAPWRHKNLHVVAFAYDETSREVLEAEEAKLTGPSSF